MKRTVTANARKKLLRRGRAILRLRHDATGEAPASGEPDFLSGLTDLERRELSEIHQALERIERGVYGRCDACFADVETERLEVIPWERYCRRCSEHGAHAGAQPGAAS